MILVKNKDTVFFNGCSLYCSGRFVGSYSGSADNCDIAECTDGRVTIRLVEDGYVVFERGALELGLLRDVGGWVEKREFEDGVIYVYNRNIDGNGLFNYSPYDVVADFLNAVVGSITYSIAAVVLTHHVRGLSPTA